MESCHEADALVIEATYLSKEAELARNFAHLTASQAAQLAQDTGAKNLILTHISRRYRERDVLTEAQKIFPNTQVARDFDDYQVRRGKFVKVEPESR
jgi:ribonuclease Z